MKLCIKCETLKIDSCFGKLKSSIDGLSKTCKECSRDANIKHGRTKAGLTSRMYFNQVYNSRKRGHIEPEYSLALLREWIYGQKKFTLLYEDWVSSKYKQDLSPSIDRLDNSKPYSFDNIELVTFKENKNRYYNNVASGVDVNTGLLNGGHCKVSQYSLDGRYIASYKSMSEAARKVGCSQANISACCSGKLNKTGGFIWKKNGHTEEE